MTDYEAIDAAGWYQIVTAFPEALTTVGWLRENGEWFIPDPSFNEASVVGAKLIRLVPEVPPPLVPGKVSDNEPSDNDVPDSWREAAKALAAALVNPYRPVGVAETDQAEAK